MSEPSSPNDNSAALARVEFGGEWSAIKALVGFCAGRRRILVPIVILAILAFLLEGIGIGLLISLAESFLLAPGESSSLGPFAGTMVTLTDRLPADAASAYHALFGETAKHSAGHFARAADIPGDFLAGNMNLGALRV